MTKQETKRLYDIIQESIKEVGITPFYCTKEIEITCPDRQVGKFPEKYLGHRHCYLQIPFIRTVTRLTTKTHRSMETSNIQLIEICEYKLAEYWKK